MLYDPEAFMSPQGGQERSNLLISPTNSLVGDIAVFWGLESSWLKDKVGRASSLSSIRDARKARVGIMQRFDADIESVKFGGQGILSPRIAGRINTKRHKLLRGVNKEARIAATASKTGMHSFFRGMRAFSIASIGATMMDTFYQLSKPGISEAAQTSDNRALGMESYLDSSQAFTQRQRAIQAIHDSQMSARNVIGNEASYLHM